MIYKIFMLIVKALGLMMILIAIVAIAGAILNPGKAGAIIEDGGTIAGGKLRKKK